VGRRGLVPGLGRRPGLIGRTFNAPRDSEPRRAIRQDVAEGLRYVLRHPVLRNISAMMALINLVAATVYTQLVVFAKRQLDASDSQVALLYAAGSAGVVLLSLAAGPLRRRLSFSVAALGALALDGLLTVVLAATRWYPAALVLWAAISGLGIFFNINTVSLRQQIVPNHLLGRVISIAGVLAWSAIPVGALAGGWAVERSGASPSSTASSGPWSPCWPSPSPSARSATPTATCRPARTLSARRRRRGRSRRRGSRPAG
jgi:predicted MFS family arabinose efflux permease